MATRPGRCARLVASALAVAAVTGCGSIPGPVLQAFDQRYSAFDVPRCRA